MLILLASFWLTSTTWYDAPPVPILRDINGKILAVGDTVSVVCTIAGFTPSSMQLGNAILIAKYGPQTVVSLPTLNLVA